ncbi:hypothetical protein [Microbispora sp. ATCC PTA-5024]|uniref:hypothetical protein n=1 Tax=Microbispora sp. ATCC PTA-5024 TaxID=316330 RepID=UPI0004058073|nr:hypothetical protein [Microbispora sp. ATCC PTA-5024]
MSRRRAGKPLASIGAIALRSALTALIVAIATAALSTEASAGSGGGHKGRNGDTASSGNSGKISINAGNGKHNQNNFAIDTPTVVDGIQEVSTGNNGSTNTQNVNCKRHKLCKVNQSQWTVSRN